LSLDSEKGNDPDERLVKPIELKMLNYVEEAIGNGLLVNELLKLYEDALAHGSLKNVKHFLFVELLKMSEDGLLMPS